jgi:hypothetical protein
MKDGDFLILRTGRLKIPPQELSYRNRQSQRKLNSVTMFNLVRHLPHKNKIN